MSIISLLSAYVVECCFEVEILKNLFRRNSRYTYGIYFSVLIFLYRSELHPNICQSINVVYSNTRLNR